MFVFFKHEREADKSERARTIVDKNKKKHFLFCRNVWSTLLVSLH